jgi:CBS-domain-containing membrane protein
MSLTSILMLRKHLVRRQPAEPRLKAIKAGVGGAIAIAALVLLGYVSDNPLLMAPFGASCVLLFSLPQSPLSQPINVIGGHLVSIAIGLALHIFLPFDWWSVAIAVGLAITAMTILRVTHPPAGADPLVVFFSSPGWDYLIFPVAIGSVILVITAWTFHKLPPQTSYPLPIETVD